MTGSAHRSGARGLDRITNLPAEPNVRVLVLCADVGEGHVTVARTLTAALSQRADVEAVELRTDLGVMGPRFGRFLTNGFQVHLDEIGWTYELAYRVFFERSVPRAAAHLALAALGGRGLRRTIAEFRADVVVTEYPVLSAAALLAGVEAGGQPDRRAWASRRGPPADRQTVP